MTKYQKIKPLDTTVDFSYQREFDESRAHNMAKKYDADLIGVPVLSLRSDGSHVRIDGQHRLASAIIAERGNIPVMCEIHEGLSRKEEASLFLRLNGGRSAVRVFDKFKARMVAHEPTALEITATLHKIGLKIVKCPTRHGVMAIQAVEAAFRNGNLETSLSTLKQWADGDSEAFEGDLIKAVSFFLKEYDEVTSSELASRLQHYAPMKIRLRMNRSRDQFDYTLQDAAVSVLRDIYNERRTKNRLGPPSSERKPAA